VKIHETKPNKIDSVDAGLLVARHRQPSQTSTSRIVKSIFFAGLFSCFILAGASRLLAQEAAPAAAVVKAQDTKVTPDERADQLLAEMTLAE
jgi:hypothetical protein